MGWGGGGGGGVAMNNTSYVNEAPGEGFLQYFTNKKTFWPSPLALDNKLMHGQLPFLIDVPQHPLPNSKLDRNKGDRH